MLKNNKLNNKNNQSGTISVQLNLFHSETHKIINDIEMGVLENGLPYLTASGLEKMIGLGHGPFYRLTNDWKEEKNKPRGIAIQQLLEQHNYIEENLFIRAEYKQQEIKVFTEPVCLALLEYYAFDASEKREKAQNTFRLLARIKFKEFIYQAVGYNPEQNTISSWQHFHDRTDLTQSATPRGYFCIFREIAPMIIPMIKNGVIINDKTVPDISVGQFWKKYWENNNLSDKYGDEIQYRHEYPPYYPQSKSNPQPAYAYPNEALAEFRKWFLDTYIAIKFPSYIISKYKKDSISLQTCNSILESFNHKQIPYTPTKK